MRRRVTVTLQGVRVGEWLEPRLESLRYRPGTAQGRLADGVYVVSAPGPYDDPAVEVRVIDNLSDMDSPAAIAERAIARVREATGGLPDQADQLEVRVERW